MGLASRFTEFCSRSWGDPQFCESLVFDGWFLVIFYAFPWPFRRSRGVHLRPRSISSGTTKMDLVDAGATDLSLDALEAAAVVTAQGASESPNGESFGLQKLLHALQAMRTGDFSVRLPTEYIGLEGKVCDTFNEI